MSQADRASAAHLNRSWVSLFEGGHTPNASLGKVLAMLNVLAITIRLTYTVSDSDPTSASVERDPQTQPVPTSPRTGCRHREHRHRKQGGPRFVHPGRGDPTRVGASSRM